MNRLLYVSIVASGVLLLNGRQPSDQTSGDSVGATAAQPPVVLLFGGDCLLADHYEDDAGNDPGLAFRGFDLFRSADVAMVNLECPVTTRGTKRPKPFNFRMKPEFVRVLADAGITIVNIANNHIFDFGPQGLFDTISYLDSAGVKHVGAGMNAVEAYRPVVVDVRGVRVGFLGFYGGGEAPGASRTSAGVARREIPKIAGAIRSLRTDDSADAVIVNLHWGTELATAPDPGEREFAHRVIDLGADAVIGHHPHVLQGIERYGKGVIVYSLGNLVFGGNGRSSYNTGLFEILIGSGDTAYRFIPIAVRDWRLSVLHGDDSAAVVQQVERRSTGFQSIPLNQGEP